MRADDTIQRITFANSTSFAFHDIADQLHQIRSNTALKASFKAGDISLEFLNERRASWGYPPLKNTFTRKMRGFKSSSNRKA